MKAKRPSRATAGARGQGAAEAQLFAREGAKVVFGDILDEEGKPRALPLSGNPKSFESLLSRYSGDVPATEQA